MFEKIMSAFGGSILGGVKELISQFHMSPAEQAALLEAVAKREHELQLKVMELAQSQLEVNKTEAMSSSLFVAGWRPFCGWTGGAALTFQFLIAPLLTWLTMLVGHPVIFPVLDTGPLMTILVGMLGLGSLRTYEKLNGVAAK